MREYETTVIVQPEISDEGTEAILSKMDGVLKDTGSTRLMCTDLGKRKLAYEVRKFQKGHYYVLSFLDDGKVVSELERNLRIEESVLRFMTVKVEEEVADIEHRVEQARIAEADQEKRAAEKAAREAEEAAARAEVERQAAEEARANAEAAAAEAPSEEAQAESSEDSAEAASEEATAPEAAPAQDSEKADTEQADAEKADAEKADDKKDDEEAKS